MAKHAASSDSEGSDASPKRQRRDVDSPAAGPADANGRAQAHNSSANGRDHDDDEDAVDEIDYDEEEENHQRIIEMQREADARTQGAKGPDRAGSIEEVHLENFMCHRLVTVKFGSQINFLVGNNGSGKSAILTAITMALGGTAKLTNRASKMGDFVLAGETSAKIQVRMKNKGHDAFQHHVYGDSIVVERRIMASTGASSYKIMAADKTVVETKKQVLETILDHWNVQVDNPMTVLSQDQSRQFLASATAADKYNFFLRGTLLAQLVDEYEVLRNNVDQMEEAVARKNEVLPELKEAYSHARSAAKAAEKAISEQERLERLRKEWAWSEVTESEIQVQRCEEIIAAEQALLEPGNKQIEEWQASLKGHEPATETDRVMAVQTEIEAINEDINTAREATAEQTAVIEQSTPRYDELKIAIAQSRDRAQAFKNEERKTNEVVKRLREQIKDYEAKIEEEKIRLGRNVQAEQQIIVDNIERIQAETADCTRKITKGREMSAQITDKIQPLNEELRDVKEQIHNAEAELRTRRARLDNMRAVGTNRLLAFGGQDPRKLINMMKAIEQERGWRHKPIGPIGTHIKLADSTWSGALESICAHTLNAFLVTTDEDRARLTQMHREFQLGHDVPIILAREDPSFWADLRTKEPQQDILTARRVLSFDNKLVEQVLITATSIESMALVRQRNDGDGLMRSEPAGVARAVSADQYIIRFNQGKSSSSAMEAWKGAARLSQDNTSRIREAEAEIAKTESDLNGLIRRKADIDRTLKELYAELNEIQGRNKELERGVAKLNHKLAVEREKLDAEEPSNLGSLEQLRKETEEELQSTIDQYKVAQEANREAAANAKPWVDEMKQIKDAIEKAKSNTQKLDRLISERTAESYKLGQAMAAKRAEMAKLEQKIADISEQTEEFRAERKRRTEAASAVCQRPEPEEGHRGKNRTPAVIEREIKALEKALKARERQAGASVEEIMENLAIRKKTLIEAKDNINSLKELCQLIWNAYNTRIERWTDFRTYLSSRAKVQFLFYLSQRGFVGKLAFDHSKMKLDLRVQTEDAANHGRKTFKDARSLSGGEKSFSTICLLLTMWEAVGSPLRCLDEFDVFMDAVNRRIAMKMMVEAAKTAQDVQFIVITPQDMQGLTFGPEVRINKMSDPDRRQGVLATGR
ncbi:Structural maintenance of chromosomes protein 6 [Microbotryomycetes sp. JL201]|nr:Structural maintenance of chromosomes protein 6 [Microbotryomycetes sp. JL201]